jgi:hypothetical protein
MAKGTAITFLTKDCRAGSATLKNAPARVCLDLKAQLMLIGRSAVTVNNPKWKNIKKAYGYSSSPLDSEIAEKVIPYFIKGTVGTLMGYGLEKPLKDPLTGGFLGPQLWVNSLLDNGTATSFAKGPFVQQVSSMHNDKGLNYFVSVNGKSQSCAFDFGCMNADSFDGHTCQAVPGQCQPETVAGHGAGFFPGRLFGAVDDVQTMFLPEMFVKGDFRIARRDQGWIENLRVDKYNLEKINFQLHGCSSTSGSRGVDCDAPTGTKDVGYQSSYDAKLDPRYLHLPLYASFPWFHPVVAPNTQAGVYDPASKISMIPCKSCPSERSFASELWTEPETGAHVYGSQKLQLNVRVRSPQTATTTIDLLLPMFWLDRSDAAAPYQAAKLAAIQSIPRTFNIIFGVLLATGILMFVAGAYMARKGFTMRRAVGLKSAENSKALTGPDADRSSTAGEEADSTLESKSSAGPQPLISAV